MSVEKSSHEGTISMSLRSKVMVKNFIILTTILVPSILITCFMLIGYFFFWAEVPGLLFSFEFYLSIVLFAGVISYLFIQILLFIYETKYVRNFSYKITGENIVINHGVFTKTRATIPFSRIQNINIVNGVFDRMFKTFTVKIETAGGIGVAQGGGYTP